MAKGRKSNSFVAEGVRWGETPGWELIRRIHAAPPPFLAERKANKSQGLSLKYQDQV